MTDANPNKAKENLLRTLAEKSPQGYKWALEFIESKRGDLQDYLRDKKINYVDYVREVGKVGQQASSAGEVLEAMRAMPDKAKDIATKHGIQIGQAAGTLAKDAKIILEDAEKLPGKAGKFAKVAATGAVLIGAFSGASANTGSVKDAAGKFAVSAAEAIDPTTLVPGTPSILGHAVAKNVGQPSEVEAKLGRPLDISIKSGVIAAVEFNGRINREQEFLLSAEHPGQLGALKMKDAAGKDIDLAATLTDKNKRQDVYAEIDRRFAKATNPDTKEMLVEMKDAARQFATLEDQRRPMPPGIVMAERRAPVTAPGPSGS